MDIGNYLSGSYFKAGDLEEDVRLSLTITGVTEEVMPRTEDVKAVIAFEETPQKLILNKTNGAALSRSLGRETDDWAGHVIELFRTTVSFGADLVPAIRVNAKADKGPF